MSNILKSKLSRGELQLFGATTLNKYFQIDKDATQEPCLKSMYVA